MTMQWPKGEMCSGCAGRKGTEANRTPETVSALRECIETREPFYCHESVAKPDPDGTAFDNAGNPYKRLPENHYRLCRAWMRATSE
jgi:hypothetical protein